MPNGTTATRSPETPKRVGVGRITDIPATVRQGYWQAEFVEMKAQPGVIFEYENVSPTTASNLRRMYGLDAHTRGTHKNDEGQERCTLIVRYVAEKVEEIKAEVARRGQLRRDAAAQKAAQAAKSAPKAAGK